MRRNGVLLLLLGCSSTPSLGNERIRIHFLEAGAGVSIRRGNGWVPVALLREVRPEDAPHFRVDGSRLRFEGLPELKVEVVGSRSLALFPGLEFLEGDERSSSDRDARGALADRRRPERWKITVPLMAYEVEGTLVALLWQGAAQPFFEAGPKNLMSLAPGTGILIAEDGATIYDAVPRWMEAFGVPEPEKWPRTMEEELLLCKAGFQSVAAEHGKHRHCAGKEWPASYAPGFGVLRHLLGEKVDWNDFPDLLDTSNCHILRWEAPFYAGELEGVRRLPSRVRPMVQLRTDGEWGFHPTEDSQRELGEAGEKVLGTSAYPALAFAKAARMTGDEELEFMALETLRHLRRYKVPRGGQSWECPLHEPDLLAAAFAVGAYVEAYKLSREAEYLKEAIRWAKAGLPFLFLWSLPGRAGMLYGSVPVFGTTHFTHPWFGVPVQWNGLVYAYYLRKLAPLDRTFPWTRIADGITASAVHQQYADGPSKGCYPDGFYDQCSRRAPPDLNPEDLVVNILTSLGRDPDPDLSLKK
jgi:hypothetical protein